MRMPLVSTLLKTEEEAKKSKKTGKKVESECGNEC